jgi:homoserine acetyltransferase
MASTNDYDIYKLGDWDLQSGEKILDAHIAYKTFGNPKSPAILYPSWYSGGNVLSNPPCPVINPSYYLPSRLTKYQIS